MQPKASVSFSAPIALSDGGAWIDWDDSAAPFSFVKGTIFGADTTRFNLGATPGVWLVDISIRASSDGATSAPFEIALYCEETGRYVLRAQHTFLGAAIETLHLSGLVVAAEGETYRVLTNEDGGAATVTLLGTADNQGTTRACLVKL